MTPPRSLSRVAAAVLLAAASASAQQTPPLGPSAPATPAQESRPAAASAGAPPAPGRKAPIIWGFVNAQLTRTAPPSPGNASSTFDLRRARIGARGEVTPHVGYAVLFDAADTSLKDAYVALRDVGVAGLELRLGQWKTPFGYEQPESDTRLLWVTSSYVVQTLARSTTTARLDAAPDSRDVGAGLSGKWRARGGLGVELAASVVNGAGASRRDDLDEKNVWGRAGISWTVGRSTARVGGSYGYGRQLAALGANGKFDGVGTPVDDVSFYFLTYGADLTLDTPFFFAAAELVQSERDLGNAATGAHGEVLARGWYAGAYGKTPWNVGPVLRVEALDRDRHVPNDRNRRYTLGAYVDVLPVSARLVLNYEIDRSQEGVRSGDRAILFGQVIF